MDNEWEVDLTKEAESIEKIASCFEVEPGTLIKAAVRWLLHQNSFVIGGILEAYGDLEELDDFTPDELAVTN